MDLKIIDHDALLEMYGNCEEFNQYVTSECEDYLNKNLPKLIEGMKTQDWQILYDICVNFSGFATHTCAQPFKQALNAFNVIIRYHRKYHEPDEPNKSELNFKESFNDEVKLNAIEKCLPIIEQIRLLKFELSKYTKSEVPDNYLLKEIEQIKQIIENEQKQYQKRQQESQTFKNEIRLDQPKDASCFEKCIIF